MVVPGPTFTVTSSSRRASNACSSVTSSPDVQDDRCAELVAQGRERLALARSQDRDLDDVLAVQHAGAEPFTEGDRLLLRRLGVDGLRESGVHDHGGRLGLHPDTVATPGDPGRLRAEGRQAVGLLVRELHDVAVEPERGDPCALGPVAADEVGARGHGCQGVQVVHGPPGDERERDPRGRGEAGEHVHAGREDARRRRVVLQRRQGAVEVEGDQQRAAGPVPRERSERPQQAVSHGRLARGRR